MRIVSLNLKKRINDRATRAALERWLARVDPDILVLQEAAAPRGQLPDSVNEMGFILGNCNVACWAKADLVRPGVVTAIPALTVDAGGIRLCCTYLSSDSSAERIRQLQDLRLQLTGDPRPVILVGDFNLAPTPEDGRYGDNESTWTKRGERRALQQLLMDLRLRDLTSAAVVGAQHFTFERINKGQWNRFRCDLAFAPECDGYAARYDHAVRKGSITFTDHSACIVEIAEAALDDQTVSAPSEPSSSREPTMAPPPVIRSHHTAIARLQLSKPVQALLRTDAFTRWGVRSILDFGCGRGKDVALLRADDINAVGYDPYPGFGFDAPPTGRFDLVLCLYVLNVLPTETDRLAAIRQAAGFLAPGGRLLIVARSAWEIDREAEAREWQRHGDGYLSDARRGMFQHGMTEAELTGIAAAASLEPTGEPIRLGRASVALVVKHRDPG